jgi:hypothetical protein
MYQRVRTCRVSRSRHLSPSCRRFRSRRPSLKFLKARPGPKYQRFHQRRKARLSVYEQKLVIEREVDALMSFYFS